MKFRYTRFEKIAGLFVILAIVGAVAFIATTAMNQRWFERKLHFSSVYDDGLGLKPGTLVTVSGIRAGKVTEVVPAEGTEVLVRYEVYGSFAEMVREDSVARIVRQFIIGEKQINILVGSKEKQLISDGSRIPSQESVEIIDFLSGGKLAPYLDTMNSVMGSMRFVMDEFLKEDRTKKVVHIYDELLPTMKEMHVAASEFNRMLKDMPNGMMVNTFQDFGTMSKNFDKLTVTHVPEAVQAIQSMNNQFRSVRKNFLETDDMGEMVRSMAKLTNEMTLMMPALRQIAPKMPRVFSKGVDALDETILTLQAMQRSWILNGAVEDIQDEKRKRTISGKKVGKMPPTPEVK